MPSYRNWAPYVPVAERRRQAEKECEALRKQGKSVQPVRCGRTIATTFWGKAWCENLEAYSDLANRLPRGRTYARNGSVVDLQISQGRIEARVSGSSLYRITITISSLETARWKAVVEQCSSQIDSLVELLQGRFSQGVMEVITHAQKGLFPSSRQLRMSCSCPDSAAMCKHLAAVLYCVGAQLDMSPELFFKLRGVDHLELLASAGAKLPGKAPSKGRKVLGKAGLSGVFGIELEDGGVQAPAQKKRQRAGAGRSRK